MKKSELYCGKCGMSFIPKSHLKVAAAKISLAFHKAFCKGKFNIVEKSYSVTEENGKHVVYRTWKVQ